MTEEFKFYRLALKCLDDLNIKNEVMSTFVFKTLLELLNDDNNTEKDYKFYLSQLTLYCEYQIYDYAYKHNLKIKD